jgi:hypothetical protein
MHEQRDLVIKRAESPLILVLQSAGDDSDENLMRLSTQCHTITYL